MIDVLSTDRSAFACIAAAWQAHEGAAQDADILRACDLGLQTQREFAQSHGLSLPATKSRLLRARQRLRERLTSACQVRFEQDGTVGGHVPRSEPAA